MIDTFPSSTYPPSYNSSVDGNERVLEARFGDGYLQTAEDGINTAIDSFKLSWEILDPTRAEFVYRFFRDRLKKTPFYFRIPDILGGSTIMCRCLSINKVFTNYHIYKISAQLEQTYHLG